MTKPTTLIEVDYRPPHLQRLPFFQHKPFKFLERFRRDKAEILQIAGVGSSIDDEVVPRDPIAPRAHFVIRVPMERSHEINRGINAYLRNNYKSEGEAANDFLEGMSKFWKMIAKLAGSTPASGPLNIIAGISEEVDDIPELIEGVADGITDQELDDALKIYNGIKDLVSSVERKRTGVERSESTLEVAAVPQDLADRIRTLRSK